MLVFWGYLFVRRTHADDLGIIARRTQASVLGVFVGQADIRQCI